MRNNSLRRVRVVMRPKERTRRKRIAAAGIAVLLMGGAAAATVRHFVQQVGNPFVYVKKDLYPSLLAVEVVAQHDALRQAAVEVLSKRGKLSASAQASVLRDSLSCIKTVTIHRNWLSRSARLELQPRGVVAAAAFKGKPAGYLSDDGFVIEAPVGLYEKTSPVVEASGAGREDLLTAAALVVAAGAPGALPSPLVSMRFLSSSDGWEMRLEDATTVIWGDGRWTDEKLLRLREVLADARAQDTASKFETDLRYFEDGKVLLRPMPLRAIR